MNHTHQKNPKQLTFLADRPAMANVESSYNDIHETVFEREGK